MHVSDWQPPEMQKQGAKAQDRASLRLQAIVKAMRPVSSIKRPTRRWPGPRLGEAAGGVLILAVILAAVCACLLLLDSLGMSPGAITEFPLAD